MKRKQRPRCNAQHWFHKWDTSTGKRVCVQCGATHFWDWTVGEKIMSHVLKAGPIPTSRPDLGPCWIWTGSKQQQGYGFFRFSKERIQVAHRAVHELLKGPVPEGLVLDHLCLNKSCVNPDHLEPVRQKVNLARAKNFTKCIRGHDVTVPEAFCYYGLPDTDGNRRRRCRKCMVLQGVLSK